MSKNINSFILKKNKPKVIQNDKTKVITGTLDPYYPYSIWYNNSKVAQIEPNIKFDGMTTKQTAKEICAILNGDGEY